MGHLKEKYIREYFLKLDADGNRSQFGVAGIEEFHLGKIRRADEDILERIAFDNKAVLDIGCGRGEAIKYASGQGAAFVIGVDFSQEAIVLAMEFTRKECANVKLVCNDALEFVNDYSIQIAKGVKAKIDIVLMLDTIEHIPRQEMTEILMLLRIMIPDLGLVAINTPHFGIDCDVIAEGLKDLSWDGTESQNMTAGMHCNRYTKSSLKSYMRHLGYFPISDHLFVPNPGWNRLHEATRWAREKAYLQGCPILLPRAHEPEIYEGYSWRTHPIMRPVRWLYRRRRSWNIKNTSA